MNPLIIIPSHNNYYYLKFMIDQIQSNFSTIMIMDNKSTDINTKKYLENLEKIENMKTNIEYIIIYNQTNYGPRINHLNHADIYYSLPQLYFITDPDILINPNLPKNFIQIMIDISEFYHAEKVGFALDISEPELLVDIPNYFMGKSLIEWELQFWENPIQELWDGLYPLYKAEIDTTFCLVNKKYENSGINIRIGGPMFVAKHLPWYKENPVISKNLLYDMALQQTGISTMAEHILRG